MVHAESSARFALWPMPDLSANADMAIHESMSDYGSADEAFSAGYESGRVEAARSIELVGAAFKEAVVKLEDARTRLLGEIHPYAVKLSVAIARHILQREIKVDERIVIDAVKRIVETLGETSGVRIRMHPDDLEAGRPHIVLGEWPTEPEWIADASMERGGCVVESPGRLIDGTMDTVLNDMARRLTHA